MYLSNIDVVEMGGIVVEQEHMDRLPKGNKRKDFLSMQPIFKYIHHPPK